jgi:hypothetical protein
MVFVLEPALKAREENGQYQVPLDERQVSDRARIVISGMSRKAPEPRYRVWRLNGPEEIRIKDRKDVFGKVVRH